MVSPKSSKKHPSKQLKTSSFRKSSSSSSSQYYAVYLAKFNLAMSDPDIPGPRHHHIIFVETDLRERSGIKFHVVGDITRNAGMTYESRAYHDPVQSASFHSKELLGFTAADIGFQSQWDALLGGLPTPPKQKAYNMATNRTELVKLWEPLTFYAPGEYRRPPWKCTEWTNDYAIPALREAGLLVEDEPVEEASGSATDAATAASGEWVWDSTYNTYRRWSQGQNDWVWASEQG
ncbi:hypothetical protein GGR56DRAFT_615927 [Xylariaceae sp. FL0804]|nr:hypothetical protein GGR56DRAFT_615927 [Xylariaceae sp. FL0804]